jgi:predicted  nucleic acid-binding Zn-ribbon protein
MSNEEFQKLVLKELSKLSSIEKRLSSLEQGQEEIKKDVAYIKNKVDGIEERVIKNSEFVYNVVQVAKNSNVE